MPIGCSSTNILSIATTIEIGSNSELIPLRRAAALASQVTEVLLHCTCQKPASCRTKRCRCFKSGAKCTYYCHRSHEITDSCPNVAPIEERSIQNLISRVSNPITDTIQHSSSTIDTIQHSSSTIDTVQHCSSTTDTIHHKCMRKRRASRLSQSEGSTTRHTRSRTSLSQLNLTEVPSDADVEDSLDTIVVRKS